MSGVSNRTVVEMTSLVGATVAGVGYVSVADHSLTLPHIGPLFEITFVVLMVLFIVLAYKAEKGGSDE